MSEESPEFTLYYFLIHEAKGPLPFYQPYWAYGESMGEASLRALEAARSQGLLRPIIREGEPSSLDHIQCEVDTDEFGTRWSRSRATYPLDDLEISFQFPFGVLPSWSNDPDKGDGDPSEIKPGYTAFENDDIFSIEVNVPEPDLLPLFERLLEVFEPFKVFWYKVHGHWEGEPDDPDEFFINEALTSKLNILRHLTENHFDSIANGHVTVTAFAAEGATNLNVTDHKKIEILTQSAEQRDRAIEALQAAGYEESDPFVTIDRQMYHWHFPHPGGKSRSDLIEALLTDGFSAWAPGNT